MKVGIVGMVQTGKTSLFNALTRSEVGLNTFGSTEVHMGMIGVPDPRFDYAVKQCNPKKISPATIEFTEGGARIDRDETQGSRDKFSTDFFSNVRNMDALVLVVRAFHDETVPPPNGGVNPLRETQQVLEELLLADLTVIEGRLERLEKSRLQKRQSPAEAAEQQVLIKLKTHLDSLQPVRTLELSEDERRSIKSYAFVSGKPIILAANVDESDAGNESPPSVKELRDFASSQNLQMISICAKAEMEVAQMEPDDEREFLQALGIMEAARDRLIRAAYAALGLICFFTVGEDEVRAWTISQGSTALGAAERIHSDIARGFIRAEVISFADFESAGGCWDEARAAGKMRLEGKEYPVKDGDILHVRFKI